MPRKMPCCLYKISINIIYVPRCTFVDEEDTKRLQDLAYSKIWQRLARLQKATEDVHSYVNKKMPAKAIYITVQDAYDDHRYLKIDVR